MNEYGLNPERILSCEEPGCKYFCRVADMPYHARTHDRVKRPGDDWMSLVEVAEALGKPKETIRSWVRFNGLPIMKKNVGRCGIWIRRQVLTKFLKENFLDDIGKIVEWAEKGK